MKREILFKGKEEDTGIWVEGFYYQAKFRVNQKEIGHWITELTPVNKPNSDYLIDPDTLCQFTGLLDKNGNKIFEGDIIKTHYGIGKVSFYHACFMIEWIDDVEANMELLGLDSNFKSKRIDIEIIGNIHD